jgi:hypothetical protein
MPPMEAPSWLVGISPWISMENDMNILLDRMGHLWKSMEIYGNLWIFGWDIYGNDRHFTDDFTNVYQF